MVLDFLYCVGRKKTRFFPFGINKAIREVLRSIISLRQCAPSIPQRVSIHMLKSYHLGSSQAVVCSDTVWSWWCYDQRKLVVPHVLPLACIIKQLLPIDQKQSCEVILCHCVPSSISTTGYQVWNQFHVGWSLAMENILPLLCCFFEVPWTSFVSQQVEIWQSIWLRGKN